MVKARNAGAYEEGCMGKRCDYTCDSNCSAERVLSRVCVGLGIRSTTIPCAELTSSRMSIISFKVPMSISRKFQYIPLAAQLR